MREIRMLRTTWRELETELRDGLRHRHEAKATSKPLLPVPTATAPALDPTGARDGENRMEQSMYGVSVPTLRRFELDMQKRLYLEVA